MTDETFLKERDEAYRTTFSGMQGEVVLKDLQYQFLEPVGYAPGMQAHDAVFFAGQRHVVSYIIAMLQTKHETQE